jgi:ankyrin repeat protein
MTQHESTVFPLSDAVAQFLQAVRDDQTQRAHALVVAHPAIGAASMHTAAAVGDVTALSVFITDDRGAATRPTQPDGTDPIVYAVLSDLKDVLGIRDVDRLAAVRLLLDAGADANATVPHGDLDGPIPILYYPSVAGREPIVRLLLERGANPNDGESVYHAAQHAHEAVLNTLLEFGADVSSRNEIHDNTPLHFLAAHREHNRITAMTTRGMAWLLAHGADPNVPSYVAMAKRGDPDAMEMPLHRAAVSGRGADVAQMLVTHGANLNAQRGDGSTAYTLAVRAGNSRMATFLAECGADLSLLSPTDRLLGACALGDETAARAVAADDPAVIASLPLDARRALGEAVVEDREQSVALMLMLGWPLDTQAQWGGTPLHLAAWNGRLAMVRQLIAAGAPINIRDTRYGSSPLAWAAHGSSFAKAGTNEDYVSIAHALIDAGARRTESYNHWNESPESLASPAVTQALQSRGFAAKS